MGRNFDDYPVFQPFKSWANTYAQDCRYLAKIWYHIEVPEVEIAASGGHQSGEGPGEKKFHQKILKSAIFELHKHYTPQKKAENNFHSDLK